VSEDEKNRALPPDEEPEEEDDGSIFSSSSQADDPTDVWSEERLREAGISLPGMAPTPATERTAPVEDSIVVAGAPEAPKPAPPRPTPRRGMSWPVTIGLALIAALAAYFAIRYLR
jgi:hypothetical protein